VLPADGVLLAARRWVRLLDRSALNQASALIRSSSDYTDLSTTQYSSALEWLTRVGLVVVDGHSLVLATRVRHLPDAQTSQLLFMHCLEELAPPWLPDADALVRSTSELPQDAVDLADTLGVAEDAALLAVRQVQGKIDLAERARVGLAGETGLVALLEERWPGSTQHIALHDDGFGYDVMFAANNKTWHLEVKTTTRRGRLVIHLSKHEHEVGMLDPLWRLVVVGLDEEGQIAALATARHELLRQRVPQNVDATATWESVQYELSPRDLESGLCFLKANWTDEDDRSLLRHGTKDLEGTFGWMPIP
jgi:Domain of unknown function (DUF3883)